MTYSSCSQYNSSNYTPLEFGLHSSCTVCAFGSNFGLCCWFWGQTECRKCGLILAARGNPVRFTSISPHAGLCLFLPRCVLFPSGDLEVSHSSIQIHCVCYILSASPPVSPLFLLRPPLSSFPSVLLYSPFLSQLIFSHLQSNPVLIILLSLIVPLVYFLSSFLSPLCLSLSSPDIIFPHLSFTHFLSDIYPLLFSSPL